MEKRSSGKQGEEKEVPKRPSNTEGLRGTLGNSDRIEALRERLYRRGGATDFVTRHALHDGLPGGHTESTAARGGAWASQAAATPHAPGSASLPQGTAPGAQNPFMKHKTRTRFRIIVALVGLAFFVAALVFSSSFLFFGSNTISGENISIDVNGPFTIGGGDQMSLQIAVANENAVAVESALLVIGYPQGTQSASEPGKELFTERIPLNRIDSGEVVNVPVRALVYGEENEEKTVTVSVEYRVSGSNATFFKEADLYRFKISSSPVTLSVDTVRSVTSGQEVEIELTVQSNASAPVSDLLIQATYPNGFDFASAEPAPDSNKDTWSIKELKPEERKTITIKGIVTGKQNEERVFDVSVGVANERDRFALASHFVSNEFGIAIEEPFLAVTTQINGTDKNPIAVKHGEHVSVRVTFENTLEDALYDVEVTARLDGNALDEGRVSAVGGFYESSNNLVTWNYVDTKTLKEVPPGSKVDLTFTLIPEEEVNRSPEITMDFAVKGKRVYEDRVPRELTGILTRTVQIESKVAYDSSMVYSDGPFTNTGPVPPIAEKTTQYAVLMTVENGSNSITGAEVTAVLPPYVTWLDLVTPGDTVKYNATSRQLTWDIGDVEANTREEVWMQISFTPSLAQVGETPTLLRDQQFKAMDRFTGTSLRATGYALSTVLSDDPDPNLRDGRVRDE